MNSSASSGRWRSAVQHVGAADAAEHAVGERGGGGGAVAAEERDLAEDLAVALDVEGELAAVERVHADLDLAALDDVDRVAGVALAEQHLAGAERGAHGDILDQPPQLLRRDGQDRAIGSRDRVGPP